MTDEQDYLGSLVKHPGWLLFLEHARKTWGPEGYGRQLKLAVAKAKGSNADLSAAVASVDQAAEEINILLSWPTNRLKSITPPAAFEESALYAAMHRGGR